MVIVLLLFILGLAAIVSIIIQPVASRTQTIVLVLISIFSLITEIFALYLLHNKTDLYRAFESSKQYKGVIVADSCGAYEINLTKNLITRIVVDTDREVIKKHFIEIGYPPPLPKHPIVFSDYVKRLMHFVDPAYKVDLSMFIDKLLAQVDIKKSCSLTHEFWLTDPNENRYYIKALIFVSKNKINKDVIALVVGKNRTEQKLIEEKKEKELYNATFIDKVTGGWNSTFFNLQAQRIIRSKPANTLAFITFDIAGFGLIADMYGIDVSDKILKHVHKVISKQCKNGDILCRHANDIFNLVVQTNGNKNIEEHFLFISEELRDMDEFDIFKNNERKESFYINLKIGVYNIADREESIFKIYDKANIAKKSPQAKKVSPHLSIGYYSDSEFLQREKEDKVTRKMETSLTNGEFEAWLQPKLDLDSRKITGAEALVRWNAKTESLLYPEEFIPVMEKNGFITQIDLYVFEEVCKFLRKIIDSNHEPIKISSNFSRDHLKSENFIKRLEEISNKYNIPRKYLEIEITETTIFDNLDTVLNITKEAHDSGFLCSIDDFGSGYSSLNMLTDLPFDVLKLDKSFLGKTPNLNRNRQYIIKSIIEMGKNLGMHTIVEGVETQEQLVFLKDVGCDSIQGYVVSKPIPMEDFFEKFISSNFRWQDI
ncbi:MAG: EAL domain-containing protein [Treponemataceae bacterium]